MCSISSDGADTNIILKAYYVSDSLLQALHMPSNFSTYLILGSEQFVIQVVTVKGA